jgi:hypothetical protein
MRALKTSAEVFDHQGSDGWLQVTPGERFRIRTSAKETKGIYTTLELIADSRNGVPMHIHQNEDEHFIVLEGSLHIANGDKRCAGRDNSHDQEGCSSCLVQSNGHASAIAGRFFAWKHRRFVQSNRRARER